MSTDLQSVCEYLEDMGVCLTEDFRAVTVTDGKALVKPDGKSGDEAMFCNDMSVLEPEEKRLMSAVSGAVISSEIPVLCTDLFSDCAKTVQTIALFTGLDQSTFSLSNGKLYVRAESLSKAAEIFSSVIERLDGVERYTVLSRKSNDILASFFNR